MSVDTVTKAACFQHTLRQKISFEGKGLHSGLAVKMHLCPAEPDFGLQFQRIDLPNTLPIRAITDHVCDTSRRGTNLAYKGAEVHTVEHVLSALACCGVDNCLIQLDAVEVPILDGSALCFVEAIEKVGLINQEVEKIVYAITERIVDEQAERGSRMVAQPSNELSVTALVDFSKEFFPPQFACFSGLQTYKKEIAPARTFCFFDEIEPLIQHNLIKGGDFSNAVVLVDGEIPEQFRESLRKITGREEDFHVGAHGYLSNTPPRYTNEPARHKILDILGDLALVGYHFSAHIFAEKPGHLTNVSLAKKIRAWIKANRDSATVYSYNPNDAPVYTARDILDILPHRWPFLLVDKIISCTETSIVGVKNVTFNEEFFLGHFPYNPVMPGVLQVEALAQTGGILALGMSGDPWNYDTYFVKIEECRFKRKIVPGDTMILVMEFAEPIRKGICVMNGKIFVGDKVCTEAKLVAQIVKTRNDPAPKRQTSS